MERAYNHFFVHASGYLTAVKHDAQSHSLTFDLAPEQYTNTYKDYNKKLEAGSKKTSFPLHCIIKESPRWTTMPKLQVGHIISVSGFLLRVCQQGGKVHFFEVNKSISWGRQPCLSPLINLQKPVRMNVHSLSISD